MTQFKEDHRETNPSLHMLYTKWAVRHLTLIDQILEAIASEANGNLLPLYASVEKQRKRLVTRNAAYHDAQEILNETTRKSPFGYRPD